MTKRKVDPLEKQEAASLTFSQKNMEDMFATADVSKVYGKPIKHETALIIPAAEVLWAGGFGAVSGFGEGPVPEGEDFGNSGGSGSGGGGRSFARPVAVIISTEEGVRVEPVPDPTKVLMAAITAAGFMAAMTLRMISSRRALRKLK